MGLLWLQQQQQQQKLKQAKRRRKKKKQVFIACFAHIYTDIRLVIVCAERIKLDSQVWQRKRGTTNRSHRSLPMRNKTPKYFSEMRICQISCQKYHLSQENKHKCLVLANVRSRVFFIEQWFDVIFFQFEINEFSYQLSWTMQRDVMLLSIIFFASVIGGRKNFFQSKKWPGSRWEPYSYRQQQKFNLNTCFGILSLTTRSRSWIFVRLASHATIQRVFCSSFSVYFIFNIFTNLRLHYVNVWK